ncbi:hypothetical protein SXHG_00120 [Synechococcus phage MRHenn-2013a]|nr:hypothetical protein SXHG_00120 [Synechococcus phage MRHenn-2013a]
MAGLLYSSPQSSSLTNMAQQQHQQELLRQLQQASSGQSQQGQQQGGGMSMPPIGLINQFMGGGSGGSGGGMFGGLLGGGGGSAGAAGGATGGSAGGATGGAAGGAAGGGGFGAMFSNPWTALAAAIAGTANYQHNKGISSWSDTLKGKAGGEMLDYYGGRADGKTHGLLGKIADQDKSVGKSLKGFTDLSELDFKNAFKNGGDAIKELFKFNII